jgi:hypothetical protein
MRLLGQTFGMDLIEGIRSAISTGLETTRSALSRQVCEWLDWRSVNGHLREIDARKALLALERAGLIELPAAQCKPPQWLGRERQESAQGKVPVEGTLGELGEVALVAVTAKETELSGLWNRLLDSHHPLGSGRGAVGRARCRVLGTRCNTQRTRAGREATTWR